MWFSLSSYRVSYQSKFCNSFKITNSMFTQLLKGANVLSNYEHFNKKTGLGRVALVACFLAFTGGIHFMLFTTSFMSGNYCIFQWSFYVIALVSFHLLEFFLHMKVFVKKKTSNRFFQLY